MASLLGSQAIIATRYEIDKPAVTQILKLLAYLRFDVLVAGIEIAEMAFESVDFVKRELALAERLDAVHDIEQPSARVRRFISEEKRPRGLRGLRPCPQSGRFARGPSRSPAPR